MGSCIVSYGIRLLLLIRPFISSFFFLTNFQALKFFVTHFLGTVRPRRLKRYIRGQWADVSCIPESGCCCLFVPLFRYVSFSLSNFQALNVFFTLFSGTVRPRILKPGTHVDIGRMYRVYRNQAAAYLSLYFFIFLSLQFSDINIFCHTFLRNYEA